MLNGKENKERCEQMINIREVRKSKGITQSELAETLMMSRPYLSQLETGRRRLSTELQDLIAQALSVNPDDLVKISGATESEEKLIIRTYRRLTRTQQKNWIAMARRFIAQSGDQKVK